MTDHHYRIWPFLYAGWMAAIIALSLHSDPPQVRVGILGWDKFQHAAAYALLTFLGWMALRRGARPLASSAIASALIALLVGAALEIGQGWLTSTRLADAWDLVADGVGAGAVLLPVLIFSSRRTK